MCEIETKSYSSDKIESGGYDFDDFSFSVGNSYCCFNKSNRQDYKMIKLISNFLLAGESLDEIPIHVETCEWMTCICGNIIKVNFDEDLSRKEECEECSERVMDRDALVG